MVSNSLGSEVVSSGVSVHGEPIETDSVFSLWSGTKMVAAVAILQLVDEGLVELDGLLADYVDFEVATPITIRHLLQHQSGLPNFWGADDVACNGDELLRGLKDLAADPNLQPGETTSYSSAGFSMLALVMSSVTGKDAALVMRDNLFGPLGMGSTYFAESETGQPAINADESDCPLHETTFGTGGDLRTSVSDLDVFMKGVFESGLLTEESLEQMLTFDAEVFGLDYGLGIAAVRAADDSDRVMYGHWGTTDSEAGVLYDPDHKRTISIYVGAKTFIPTAWNTADWADKQ